MTKDIYIQCLKFYQDKADCQLFFAWLEEHPDFMDMHELEIQINFMMYTVAAFAYMDGVAMGVTYRGVDNGNGK